MGTEATCPCLVSYQEGLRFCEEGSKEEPGQILGHIVWDHGGSFPSTLTNLNRGTIFDDYLQLQQDIDKLYSWTKQNLLQLNPTKCKYMVISRKRHPLLPSSGLNVNGTALVKVEHFKYLGV